MKRSDGKDGGKDGEVGKPSRRGFLGGALAVTLAAVLLPTDRTVPVKPKWEVGKTRWIGHW